MFSVFAQYTKKSVMALAMLVSVGGLVQTAHAQNTFPASGNVGIGTASPGYPLDVQSSNFFMARFRNKGGGSDGTALFDIQNAAGTFWRLGVGGTGNGLGITAGQFYLERGGLGAILTASTSGNIGIGTSTPSGKLNVYEPNQPTSVVLGNPSTGTGGFTSLIMSTSADKAGYGSLQAIKSSGTEWGNIVLNQYGGNVGIGTSTPSAAYKLSVNGSIRTKEVVVESGWADFVFAKDYTLRPLKEVEAFIAAHKHLPDMPTAAEVQENGVKVGEMETKLLQKIEELTLYLIEQQKQMEVLKTKLSQLENH